MRTPVAGTSQPSARRTARFFSSVKVFVQRGTNNRRERFRFFAVSHAGGADHAFEKRGTLPCRRAPFGHYGPFGIGKALFGRDDVLKARIEVFRPRA